MQIHTSRHAGGIASAAIRSSTSGSSIRSPSGPRYSKPRPRRRRLTPGAAQLDRRSLGTDSYARARVRAPRLAALLRLSAFRLRVRAAFFAAALRFSGPWRRRSLTSPTTELRPAIARLATFGLPAPLVARVTCLAIFLRTPRALRLLNRSVSVLAICSSSVFVRFHVRSPQRRVRDHDRCLEPTEVRA